jgi:hypothetical protein
MLLLCMYVCVVGTGSGRLLLCNNGLRKESREGVVALRTSVRTASTGTSTRSLRHCRCWLLVVSCCAAGRELRRSAEGSQTGAGQTRRPRHLQTYRQTVSQWDRPKRQKRKKIKDRLLTASTLIFVGRLWPSFRISRLSFAAEHRPWWPPQKQARGLAFLWHSQHHWTGISAIQFYFIY